MKLGKFYVLIMCLIVFSFALLVAACGPDEAAPSVDTTAIPDTVFYNDTGSTEYYLLTGRAADNTNVDQVLVSGDNGATWHTAEIDSDPPNSLWDVEWSYLAASSDLPAGMHTILVRASDRDGNETTSDPLILDSQTGSTISSLQSVFIAATTGDIIGLSTGEGYAYGDSAAALTIPIEVDLTVLGSGYGSTATSGGLIPVADPENTILEADPATASLFSVDADLALKRIRLVGADTAVRIADSGGPDPQLQIDQCLFDRQAAWALYAQDDDLQVDVEVAGSIVDASRADSLSGGGGLYLINVNATVTESGFYYQSATAPGAGVLLTGGEGIIDSSEFAANGLAIWTSGAVSTITSCSISGSVSTTNGIDISGTGAVVTIRNNTIEDHNGFAARVRGSAEPKFFGNGIKSDSITYPNATGILIMDSGSSPELGRFPYDESGCNSFESSSSPVVDFVVEADGSTSAASVFYAGNNFWGVQFDTGSEIHAYKIYDNRDFGSAASIDLTGTTGGVNPVIWNGTGECP